jgi:hypothetical protein
VIADHLLDNGVIVPPVKVGQTVWDIKCKRHTVRSLRWRNPGNIEIDCEDETFSRFEFMGHCHDTFFLTWADARQAQQAAKRAREEAEQAHSTEKGGAE